MEREQVIALAREAGLPTNKYGMPTIATGWVERFAALVAEAKDKEIAELAEKYQRVACAYLELSEKVKETGIKTSKWGVK